MAKDDQREQAIVMMQVEITHEIMEKWHLSVEQFIELDEQYKINEFIRMAYEMLHLSGVPGILLEVRDYLIREGYPWR